MNNNNSNNNPYKRHHATEMGPPHSAAASDTDAVPSPPPPPPLHHPKKKKATTTTMTRLTHPPPTTAQHHPSTSTSSSSGLSRDQLSKLWQLGETYGLYTVANVAVLLLPDLSERHGWINHSLKELVDGEDYFEDPVEEAKGFPEMKILVDNFTRNIYSYFGKEEEDGGGARDDVDLHVIAGPNEQEPLVYNKYRVNPKDIDKILKQSAESGSITDKSWKELNLILGYGGATYVSEDSNQPKIIAKVYMEVCNCTSNGRDGNGWTGKENTNIMKVDLMVYTALPKERDIVISKFQGMQMLVTALGGVEIMKGYKVHGLCLELLKVDQKGDKEVDGEFHLTKQKKHL